MKIRKMEVKYRIPISSIPFRLLSFLFVIYNNSSWATIGKSTGFYCDDESIKKPFSGDSVHVTYLFSVLLTLFPLFIYISERLIRTEIVKGDSHSKTSPCRLFLKFYYSGFLYVLLVTEVLKVSVTELRPHFYYSCLPDMTNIDCSKGLITDFNCTNDGPSWLVDRDIYKSFPSGHAALSSYAFIFMTMYINSKRKDAVNSPLKVWWSRLIPPLCFLWAIICCVSRILDNRHFWWDVLIGIGIGTFGGFAMAHWALMKTACKSQP